MTSTIDAEEDRPLGSIGTTNERTKKRPVKRITVRTADAADQRSYSRPDSAGTVRPAVIVTVETDYGGTVLKLTEGAALSLINALEDALENDDPSNR